MEIGKGQNKEKIVACMSIRASTKGRNLNSVPVRRILKPVLKVYRCDLGHLLAATDQVRKIGTSL